MYEKRYRITVALAAGIANFLVLMVNEIGVYVFTGVVTTFVDYAVSICVGLTIIGIIEMILAAVRRRFTINLRISEVRETNLSSVIYYAWWMTIVLVVPAILFFATLALLEWSDFNISIGIARNPASVFCAVFLAWRALTTRQYILRSLGGNRRNFGELA